MDRDKRLTGSFRGQTDNPVAPPEFAVNSEWKVEFPIFDISLLPSLKFMANIIISEKLSKRQM